MTAFAPGRSPGMDATPITHTGAPTGTHTRPVRMFFVLLWLFCPATAVVGWPFAAAAQRLRRAIFLSAGSVAVVAALTWFPATRAEAVATTRATVLAPLTAAAIVYGVGHGGSVHVDDGIVVVTGMDGGHGPRSGFVLGNAFLTRRDLTEIDADLLAHETMHANQWAALGLWFPVAYLGSDLLTGAGSENVFEIAAGLEGGDYHT